MSYDTNVLLYNHILEVNRSDNYISHTPSIQSREVSHSITSAPSYFESLSYSLVRFWKKTVFVTSVPFQSMKTKKNLLEFIMRAGRKAIFITSVPFYWFLFFKYLVGYFGVGLFFLCVGFSYILSTMSKDWGLITWGLKA